MPRPLGPPLTDEQSALAGAYLPLARKLIRPVILSYPSLADELYSEIGMALVRAARTYRPGSPYAFATHVRCRVWGAVRDVLRRARPKGWRRVVRGEPSAPRRAMRGDRCDRRPTILPLSGDVEIPGPSAVARCEQVDAALAILKPLPSRHAEVMRLLYVEGMDQVEVAPRLGVARSRISCLHAEALGMLREAGARKAATIAPAIRS